MRAGAGALALVLFCVFAASASAAPTKTVSYRGYAVTVPAAWPVFRLSARSTVCVRFNRHAVYLGRPGRAQRCPATTLGRTEAILVAPLGATAATALPGGGDAARATIRSRRLQVTATWNHERALVQRAVGAARLHPTTEGLAGRRAGALPQVRPDARAAAAPHAVGTVYEGPGFDACSTPSTTTMTAWNSSPYRALGVYIGGANRACSQVNLTAGWVAQEEALGWHLIPTYVGLQAPSNSCGCEAIVPAQASAQGAAAAADAVAQAQAFGIGPGNPIYDDMENYSRTTTNTTAVLAFLQAWTQQLHAEGYGSGVYSSSGSGMVDLASQYGTTYTEPDDVWFADWNGAETTADSYFPATDWPSGQRIHQYQGGHNETWGGATLNVDSNYLDGATAYGGAVAPPPPSLKVTPSSNGTITLYASWPGGSGVAAWRTLGGAQQAALVGVAQNPNSGSVTAISSHSAYPYYAVQALDSSGNVLATSAVVAAAPHLALYGHSLFVPSQGLVGVPAGCFTGSSCDVSLTIWVGRKRIARSGAERLNSGAGLLYFKLSPSDRALLARAAGHRLAVTVIAKDVSGTSATAPMSLTPFVTTGAGPGRSAGGSSTVRLIGLRDFVYRRAVGGLLAACSGPTPCTVQIKITAGHSTVATTGPEVIGANEATYLSFRLNSFGRSLLARALGNQLGAAVTVTGATPTVRAHIALTSFS